MQSGVAAFALVSAFRLFIIFDQINLLCERERQDSWELEPLRDFLDIFSIFFLLEAGLFESKIRIRYACVHLGGFTKEISSSH